MCIRDSFYFVHWPDSNTPADETMAALENLKKMGKIRFIGVSNYSQEQIGEAQKWGKIDVQQPPFSMVNQKFTDLMNWGFAQGIDLSLIHISGSDDGQTTAPLREYYPHH